MIFEPSVLCFRGKKNGEILTGFVKYTCSEPGYEFDKGSLLEYNHMCFGGPPVTVETVEEADELLSNDEKETAIGNHVKFLFCLPF